MVKENSKKNKHLTPEDRKEIEECLGKRMTFKAIGKLISKDPTTISYEIKHHRSEHRNSFVTEEGDSLTCTYIEIPFHTAPPMEISKHRVFVHEAFRIHRFTHRITKSDALNG